MKDAVYDAGGLFVGTGALAERRWKGCQVVWARAHKLHAQGNLIRAYALAI